MGKVLFSPQTFLIHLPLMVIESIVITLLVASAKSPPSPLWRPPQYDKPVSGVHHKKKRGDYES